uniref:Uncharacterized protein n=1 Tax=viral metagenome TaxID=1070528 RepID=A0A6M3LTV9_9ZZZZ
MAVNLYAEGIRILSDGITIKPKTIKYNRGLVIANIEQLAHGTGAKYLEVLVDNAHGVLIAKQWHRKPVHTDKFHALIEF